MIMQYYYYITTIIAISLGQLICSKVGRNAAVLR